MATTSLKLDILAICYLCTNVHLDANGNRGCKYHSRSARVSSVLHLSE